jgi:probable selenium-dependent hydroxylase accessory protein YqeC
MQPFEEEVDSLTKALAIEAREHIAIVGAGGKTALLFALAEELRKSGKRVITTTTTKVWHGQAAAAPCVLFTEGESLWKEKLKAGLAKEGHAFLGRTTASLAGKPRSTSLWRPTEPPVFR